jgi:Putative DNA-binding domain
MSDLAWPSQQRDFALALLDPDAATPDFLETRNRAAPGARFDVYRNNVHASLIDALLAAFAVTARLVSEDSFRALAGAYLRRELPQGAALHEYGARLPEFIRECGAADSPSYLPDVAALEHAWWQAYGAADAPALATATLAALDGERLLRQGAKLHPAARLLSSVHPVHGIWAAHQGDGEPLPPSRWEGECVLITRPDVQVHVQRITAAEHTLLTQLAAGAPLECAAEAALAQDPTFDLGASLLRMVAAGAIQELAA